MSRSQLEVKGAVVANILRDLLLYLEGLHRSSRMRTALLWREPTFLHGKPLRQRYFAIAQSWLMACHACAGGAAWISVLQRL